MSTDDGAPAPPAAGYVEVALPVPLRRLFTYRVPEPLRGKLEAGARVAVPFSRRKLAGFVVAHREEPPEGVKRVYSVAGALEREPVFEPELLAFLDEAARYYLHPLGEVLRAAAPALPTGSMKRLRKDGFLDAGETLPGRSVAHKRVLVGHRTDVSAAGMRLGPRQKVALAVLDECREVTAHDLKTHVKEPRATLKSLTDKGLVRLEEREVRLDPFFGKPMERDVPPALTGAQRFAVDAMVAALAEEGPSAFLLHGVTGSGKTEVYLHLIAEARAKGRGAILLVPEIALTPQLVGRFRARFGDDIAVLHSALTPRSRDEAWRRLRSGEVHIAVGARSALFAPVQELGVIVVDEEHDSSFKQEEGFRYQARDMALLRAHRAGAVAILGTATPSVESYHLAEQGRLRLLELPERATKQALPEVEVVDLRRHRHGPSGHPLLSGPLHKALTDCLASEGQAILFLNRRGFAPSLRCMACGEVPECPSCSVSLTEHRRADILRCHYCDYSAPPGEKCSSCGAAALERMGLGTEQLEDTLAEVFAPAKVGRLDRDTASGAGVEAILERLRRREIDILVGTQMVTKGHDIPGVTLVGVVFADHSLSFPDFRAAERTFQLLAQVAGRAGRGDRPGRVVFQTFQPNHPSVLFAAQHDYAGFYEAEKEARRELEYSPYARLVAVRIDAAEESKAQAVADELATLARAQPAIMDGTVRLLGPAPAPIARLRGRFRYRLLMLSSDRRRLRSVAAAIAHRVDQGLSPARASVDVDPVSML